MNNSMDLSSMEELLGGAISGGGGGLLAMPGAMSVADDEIDDCPTIVPGALPFVSSGAGPRRRTATDASDGIAADVSLPPACHGSGPLASSCGREPTKSRAGGPTELPPLAGPASSPSSSSSAHASATSPGTTAAQRGGRSLSRAGESVLGGGAASTSLGLSSALEMSQTWPAETATPDVRSCPGTQGSRTQQLGSTTPPRAVTPDAREARHERDRRRPSPHAGLAKTATASLGGIRPNSGGKGLTGARSSPTLPPPPSRVVARITTTESVAAPRAGAEQRSKAHQAEPMVTQVRTWQAPPDRS